MEGLALGKLCLCVDSSIKGVALALVGAKDGSRVVLWQMMDHQRYGSAGILSQYLQQALRVAQATVADIGQIIVSVGPGSFTGIKVGLAWCYGLAAANRQEVVWHGVSALQLAAQQMALEQPAAPGGGQRRVTLLLPSTTTHGYLASYDPQTRAERCVLLPLEQLSADYLGQLATELKESQVLLAAPWPLLERFMDEQGLTKTVLSSKELMEFTLAGMVAEALVVPEAAFQLALPRPRYLRKSSAEEKLEQQRG